MLLTGQPERRDASCDAHVATLKQNGKRDQNLCAVRGS